MPKVTITVKEQINDTQIMTDSIVMAIAPVVNPNTVHPGYMVSTDVGNDLKVANDNKLYISGDTITTTINFVSHIDAEWNT